jgi:hypothetical protein
MVEGQFVAFDHLMDVRAVLLCERPLQDRAVACDEERMEFAASVAATAEVRGDGPVSRLPRRCAQPRGE